MNDKPRLVEIPATLAAEFAERSANGDLSVPHVVSKTYCDADELKDYDRNIRMVEPLR
jgi:hypothetical protein